MPLYNATVTKLLRLSLRFGAPSDLAFAHDEFFVAHAATGEEFVHGLTHDSEELTGLLMFVDGI